MKVGLKIFTGNSNPLLAEEITRYMGISLGVAEVGSFSDGCLLYTSPSPRDS